MMVEATPLLGQISRQLAGYLVPLPSSTVSSGGSSIAISADGTSVYSADYAPTGILSMHARNPVTGVLTALTPATIATGAYPGPQAIVVSSDGISVYVGTNDANIAVYNRNVSTGVLTASGTVATPGSQTSLVISADGTTVYGTNSGPNSVTRYLRNISNGTLTASGSVAAGIYPVAIAISTDGTSVYAANRDSDSVSVYNRNVSTGVLTASGTVAVGNNPTSIVISNDGTSVYVTNRLDYTVSMFSRNTSTGVLTALTPATITSITYTDTVAISPDGKSVYVSNYSGGIAMFTRNTSTGALTPLPAARAAGQGSQSAMAISGDGTSLYLAGNGVIKMFYRHP